MAYRRRAYKNDSSMYSRTAMSTKTINLDVVVKRGGIRL